MASAELTTPVSYVARGSVFTVPVSLKINVGYTLNCWHFEAGTQNPFSCAIKSEYYNDRYSKVTCNYQPGVLNHIFTLISIIDLIWGKSISLKKWRWKTENIQVF